jgi:hypothetical protein
VGIGFQRQADAALFINRKGNVAKPLRLALGDCIIQTEYGYSDEKTTLQFSLSRKKTAKKIHKAVGKQLLYLARNLAAIDEKLALGRTLSEPKNDRLAVIRTLYKQQKYMFDHRCHTAPSLRLREAHLNFC